MSTDPAYGRGGHSLSLDHIAEAGTLIDPVFRDTPQFECDGLSAELGMRLIAKVETLNPIRSFKGRGASYLAAKLPPGKPIVTASAGNLGQGLAYACRDRGIPLTVFAARSANPLKLDRMRELGAQVLLHGSDFDEAKIEARRHAAAEGLPMVEDGLEPALAEGAGTIAVELLRHPTPIDVVLVPLGNGAILGGIARWMSEHSPGTEVIGVAASGAPCMYLSWHAGRPIETQVAATIADGIATRIPVAVALDDLQGTITDVVLVGDDAMVDAMLLAFRHLGLVLEPSGAAGLAAAMTNPERFRGRTVAAVLSGGNLTAEQTGNYLG